MPQNSFFDNIIDKIFNIKKETVFLLFTLVIGFLIRLIVAINLPISADDMVHALHAINFFTSNKLIDYSQSAGLWHLFTDIIYKIFGTGQLSSRSAALIFGTLSIVSIYLLTRQFYDKKTSLIAALLLATAPFHIINTTSEMDVFVMFFVITGSYLFVSALREDKNYKYLLAGLFFGLALYSKVYSLLFIPSLVIYSLYYKIKNKKKIWSSKGIKQMFGLLLIAGLFAIPTLAHNYLLFKDKGFVDLQFTSALGVGKEISSKYFGWDGHFNSSYEFKPLIFGNSKHSEGWSTLPTLILTPSFILFGSPIIFILGVLSLIYFGIFKRNDSNYPAFFISFVLVLLIYLSGIFLLSKHYLFLEIFLIPLAARLLSLGESKISRFIKGKNILIILLAVLTVFVLFFLGYKYQIFGESAAGQFISYSNNNLPKQALYLADSRIYSGMQIWMLYGKISLDAAQFIQLINQPGSQDQAVPVSVYYIECVTEDCGWGTIASQPQINATMESFTSFFMNNSELIETISQPVPAKPYFPPIVGAKQPTFRVYKMTIPLNPQIVKLASQPKSWFLYYVGYPVPSSEFDYYDTHSDVNSLIDKGAHIIARISLFLCFASIFLIFYLLIRDY